MLPERKEHARQVVQEARQIRRTVASAGALGSPRQGVHPLLLKSFDQLLELVELLLIEQDQYESRLHRTPLIDPNQPLHTSPAQ